MEKLAELHPSFLRFPGGNYLEGDEINERFDWKKTIGPLEDRPGHRCPWGYRSSDGLGLLEFLNWCEDLNMEPILAVYAGYSLRQRDVKPGPDLEPYVQEALEEIEYVIGDAATTKWGARRAKDGHPQPFKLQYVEIGNEDAFDRSRSYDGRFAQFFDAIKKKYPNLQCISTVPVASRKADLVDDHDYPSAQNMLRRTRRYQDRDPELPKVFFGEWATQGGRPTPTMALCDRRRRVAHRFAAGRGRRAHELLRAAAGEREPRRVPVGHQPDRLRRGQQLWFAFVSRAGDVRPARAGAIRFCPSTLPRRKSSNRRADRKAMSALARGIRRRSSKTSPSRKAARACSRLTSRACPNGTNAGEARGA